MKKTKKDMAIHATIIGIIVIILIVSVVKLVKWNQGSEDAGEVITDENFDTEPEDYVTAMTSVQLASKTDDGVCDIVFLGDDLLSQYTGKDGLPGLTESMVENSKTYNIGFDDMHMSASSSTWSEENASDSFSLYWVAKSIALKDFNLLNNYADQVNPDFTKTVKELESIDFSTVDVLAITYGVHDYLDGRLITDVADPNSISAYSGALKSSIEAIQEAYPHIRIIVMSPTFCRVEQDGSVVNCDVTNTGYGMLADYMVAAKSIAVELNVSYLDNYYGVKINAETYKDYLEDNIHPNEAGRKLIAERLADVINKNLTVEMDE